MYSSHDCSRVALLLRASDRSPRAQPRRPRALNVGLSLAIAVIVGGMGSLLVLSEPANASYSLGASPWLLWLGDGRLGVEFTNSGEDNSAVFLGVVDLRGNWLSNPAPVTPIFSYDRCPCGAVSRLDDRGRVHIAWALWEPDRDLLTYYYLRIDPSGSLLVESEPLGATAVREIYEPLDIGLRVIPELEQVAWANGSHYEVVTLNTQGDIVSGPEAVSAIDEASFFPPRQASPRGASPYDGSASAIADGNGNTYYLWMHTKAWFEGRTNRSERELRFLSQRPEGDRLAILYSTDDLWWLKKPLALPSVVLVLAGSVTTVGLALTSLRRIRVWA